jgi:thiol:disulfide interchange protein DsbC
MSSACATTDPQDMEKGFIKKLQEHNAGIEYQSIRKVPDSPFYELQIEGTNLLYVTEDGRYIISGELVDLQTKKSIRAERANIIVKEELAQVDEKHMLIYGEPNASRTITVFLDLDCPFCAKFSEDIDSLTRSGIRFRILFTTRGDVNSESFQRAVALWCERDNKGALQTAFKTVHILKPEETCYSPIFASHELARQLDINRTPAFVDEDGHISYGYLGKNKFLKTIGVRPMRNQFLNIGQDTEPN